MRDAIASQFGPPALRRSDGAVFEIDRILRFSEHEDFAVFSLQNDPQPPALLTNREPKLDQPVLAVGNALGEGVVIRDGLFTSETPEAQDGRWKWIRFSAAASPGNSGGPLCDGDGRVIGIVVRKSPNENLNYALPITRMLDAQEKRVLIRNPRSAYHSCTARRRMPTRMNLSCPSLGRPSSKRIRRSTSVTRTNLVRSYSKPMQTRFSLKGREQLTFYTVVFARRAATAYPPRAGRYVERPRPQVRQGKFAWRWFSRRRVGRRCKSVAARPR